jgi:hypothetical protein
VTLAISAAAGSFGTSGPCASTKRTTAAHRPQRPRTELDELAYELGAEGMTFPAMADRLRVPPACGVHTSQANGVGVQADGRKRRNPLGLLPISTQGGASRVNSWRKLISLSDKIHV